MTIGTGMKVAIGDIDRDSNFHIVPRWLVGIDFRNASAKLHTIIEQLRRNVVRPLRQIANAKPLPCIHSNSAFVVNVFGLTHKHQLLSNA